MVVIGILLTLLFGLTVVWIVQPDLKIGSKLALAYLLGIGLQTLLMFYLSLLGIKLTFINVAIWVFLVSILIFILGKSMFKRAGNPFTYTETLPVNSKKNALEKLCLLIFLGLSIYVLIFGLYWPVVGWDSIALYDFRAKVFYNTGFMDDAIRRGYFFGYPLMTSMAHTWVYLLGFSYPKFLYSLMYISLGVLFFELCGKRVNRVSAWVFTILLMIAPPIFTHAAFDYTNLPYTIYFLLGSIFLYWFTVEKKISWLVLAALTTGLSTWVRSTDPFWTVNFFVLVLFLILKRKNILYFLVYSIIFFVIQQSWSLFLSKMAPHVSAESLAQSSVLILLKGLDLGRLAQTFVFVLNEIIFVILPYLVLLLGAIVLKPKSVKQDLFLYLIVFGNFALLFVGTYVFSFIWDGWSLIGESLGRIVFIFVPLFLYASAMNIDDKIFFVNKKTKK